MFIIFIFITNMRITNLDHLCDQIMILMLWFYLWYRKYLEYTKQVPFKICIWNFIFSLPSFWRCNNVYKCGRRVVYNFHDYTVLNVWSQLCGRSKNSSLYGPSDYHFWPWALYGTIVLLYNSVTDGNFISISIVQYKHDFHYTVLTKIMGE